MEKKKKGYIVDLGNLFVAVLMNMCSRWEARKKRIKINKLRKMKRRDK